MQYFIIILCMGFFQLSYSFEFTEDSLASQMSDCSHTCEIEDPTTREGYFNKHIPSIKKLQESIGNTIKGALKDFPDKEPSAKIIAKIVHDSSNLGNTLNKIAQSRHLDKLNQETICKPLCEGGIFLNKFSRSFIEDLPDIEIPQNFKEKVTSDWFKKGMFDISSSIKTLEKHLQLEDHQFDLLSYLPLIKNKHRELTDTVCRMLKTENDAFIDDLLDFNRYAEELGKLM